MKERLLPSCFGYIRIERTEEGYTAYLNNIEGQGENPKDAYTRVLQRVAHRLIAGSLMQNQFEFFYFRSNKTGKTIKKGSLAQINELALQDQGTIVIHKADCFDEKGIPYKVVFSAFTG